MSARIRLADPADAAACRTIYAPIVRDTIISFELEPPTVDEMAARIRTTLASYPWLVWKLGAWVDVLARAAAALLPDAGAPGVSRAPHGR